MLILGLLLLVAVGALITGVVTGNTAQVKVDLFGHHYLISKGGLFVLGAAVGVFAVLGLAIFFSGLRRGGRVRKQQRTESGEKRQQEAKLREENARLARELHEQRATIGADGTDSAAPAAPAAPAAQPAAEQPGKTASAPGESVPPA